MSYNRHKKIILTQSAILTLLSNGESFYFMTAFIVEEKVA